MESAVGAHLANAGAMRECTVHYWRERNLEVGFVIERGKQRLAIEVKSGRSSRRLAGMGAFGQQFPHARKLLVGGDGVDLELFLSRPVIEWFQD